MARTCYVAAEVAALLGHSIDWFYSNRRRLIAEADMPAPIVHYGKMRFDRASIDAWLGRYHPAKARIGAPANDAAPLPPPAGADEWRDYLRRAYAAEPPQTAYRAKS